MGLDMYLRADLYIPETVYQSNGSYVVNSTYNKIVDALDVDKNLLDGYGMHVQVPVGYWRKANAIHRWFVEKCGNGIDECQNIFVSRTRLIQLQDTCNDVLEERDLAKADFLLPPLEGFFFGSQELDEGYWDDLQLTVTVIANALSIDTESYQYQASW